MNLFDLTIAAVFPFTYLFLLAGFFIYLFGKRLTFQAALPIATMSAVLFVLLSTVMTHSLAFGFWVTVIAGLMFLPLVILDKDRRAVFKNNIFTPGFVVFCVTYIFCFLLYGSKVVPLLSDASMHWAPHVWTMWLRDDLYTSPGLSIVNHGDYPPVVQLFELIFSKAAGLYHEGLLYVSAALLSCIMLLPITDGLAWNKYSRLKQWGMTLLVTVTVLTIPLVFSVAEVYYHLHVDAALGATFAYAVYIAVSRSKKFTISDFLIFSLTITFLSLVKQIGLVLAGLVVLIYGLCLLLAYRQKYSYKKFLHYFRNYKKHLKTIIAIFVIAALPIISLKAWSYQTGGYVSPDPGIAIFKFDPTDTVRIPDVYVGSDGSESQQYFSNKFINHVFFDPAGITLNIIADVSYMQFALLFVALMCLVWLMYTNKNDRSRILIVAGIVTLGWFLYCFVLYATFLFGGMKPIELMTIDTPNRYLRTYLFAMLIIAITFLMIGLIRNYTDNTKSRAMLHLFVAHAVFFGLFFNQATYNQLGIGSTPARLEEFSRLNVPQTVENLKKLSAMDGTFERPAKVAMSVDDATFEDHYLQYKALPNRVTTIGANDFASRVAVCTNLKRNEYFIMSYPYEDKSKWDTLKSCFSNSNDIELVSGGMYKIIQNDIGMSLQRI